MPITIMILRDRKRRNGRRPPQEEEICLGLLIYTFDCYLCSCISSLVIKRIRLLMLMLMLILTLVLELITTATTNYHFNGEAV